METWLCKSDKDSFRIFAVSPVDRNIETNGKSTSDMIKYCLISGGIIMLNLILGPAGCGKSSRILDRIVKNAGNGTAGQLLLVPEYFSHETERRLAAAGGPSICRYAEVLSFSRLATRVFGSLTPDQTFSNRKALRGFIFLVKS